MDVSVCRSTSRPSLVARVFGMGRSQTRVVPSFPLELELELCLTAHRSFHCRNLAGIHQKRGTGDSRERPKGRRYRLEKAFYPVYRGTKYL